MTPAPRRGPGDRAKRAVSGPVTRPHLLRYRVRVDSDVAHRLRLALELFEAGRDLMLQNLRRKHPNETEAEIQQRLGEWLRGPDRVYRGRPYAFRHTPP